MKPVLFKNHFLNGLPRYGAILLPALWFCACSVDTLSGGSGAETGNPVIAGIVLDKDGLPSGSVLVKLIPYDYDPVQAGKLPDTLIDTTDDSGRFAITAQKGTYSLLAQHPRNGTKLLKSGIILENDTLSLAPDTLEKTGLLVLTNRAEKISTGDIIYIKGTDMIIPVERDSPVIILDSVPAGVIPDIYYYRSTVTSSPSLLLTKGTTVQAGDTAIAASILFISNYTGSVPDVRDSFLIEHLEKSGYTVYAVDESLAVVDDTAGMNIVLISPTVSFDGIVLALREKPVPLLIMEYTMVDEIGMTGQVSGTDYGFISNRLYWEVSMPQHPIASGLIDSVQFVLNPSHIDWGKPASDADKIFIAPGVAEKAAVFCYESGDTMPEITAPARRAAFLLLARDTEYLTNAGWLIFDRTLLWSLHLESLIH